MKAHAFKKLIKEAVKEALKEELQLSSKQNNTREVKQENFQAGSLEEALNMTKSTMSSEDYKNVLSFDSSDAKNFFNPNSNSDSVQVTGPQPGLDISNLDFVKKASSVLKASEQKDRKKVNGL